MCVLTPDIVLLRWLIITKIMHAYVLPLQRLSGLCSGAAGGSVPGRCFIVFLFLQQAQNRETLLFKVQSELLRK